MTSKQQEAVEMDACRAAFEDKAGYVVDVLFRIYRGGEYHNTKIQADWILWQAAWHAATKGDAEGQVTTLTCPKCEGEFACGKDDVICKDCHSESIPQPAAKGDGVEIAEMVGMLEWSIAAISLIESKTKNTVDRQEFMRGRDIIWAAIKKYSEQAKPESLPVGGGHE